jgi:GNAT superfamily N-acetyltransferase
MEASVATNGLEIRPMQPRDAERVAELALELGYKRSAEQVSHWIEELEAAQREQAAFVACAGGEAIGWIEVAMERRLQYEPYALIGGLVVKDGFRGHGVGKRLCEEAERWGRACGCRIIRVTSRSTREDTHRFYERDGYRRIKMSVVFEKPLAGNSLHPSKND